MPEHHHQSPLHDLHDKMEALFLSYTSNECCTELVETFGDLDMEYAAIRKGCVLFDEPHTGVILAKGTERADFLNRMLTAKTDDLQAGQSRRAFWLNRKGRIEADILVNQHKDEMHLVLDRHLSKATAESLSSFVFTEDIELADASDRFHHLSLHGPTAFELLATASDSGSADCNDLQEHASTTITIAGTPIVIEREDLTGEVGLRLRIATQDTKVVYQHLLDTAQDNAQLKARPTGWLAINAARIEAGHPMYNIDFDDTHVPVESGVIDSRVSLTKGCYLGQEVVARMHARKACTKRVVAIRIEHQQITTEHQDICQPTGGSQVFVPGNEGETPIGIVSSSTISPMLGAIPICFAMLKDSHTKPGTKLTINAEGQFIEGTVQESLVFWSKAKA